MKLEVVLLLLAGLEIAEIAKRTGASEANVRWYHRELKKARGRLSKGGRKDALMPDGWRKL